MKTYIEKIKFGQNLSVELMQAAMKEIMSGAVCEDDLSSFLLALREKGPTVEEITGAALTMREFSIKVNSQKHKNILDTCGTGGDKLGTFNISTVAAFVAAGAGAIVAKHGNQSVSSKCGSADVLESLGVNVQMDVSRLDDCLDKVGIVFLFAQKLHPAMKHAAPVRKSLGIETIFNVLGPLTNPAKATHQMMGIYKQDFVEPMAHVLKNLGLKKALVVHGIDGLDEITTTARTSASEFNGKEVVNYTISPEKYDIPYASLEDIVGGELDVNTQIALDILNGGQGPKRDIVVLNAGHALYIGDLAKSVEQGIEMAIESIDSGKALKKLELLKGYTN